MTSLHHLHHQKNNICNHRENDIGTRKAATRGVDVREWRVKQSRRTPTMHNRGKGTEYKCAYQIPTYRYPRAKNRIEQEKITGREEGNNAPRSGPDRSQLISQSDGWLVGRSRVVGGDGGGRVSVVGRASHQAAPLAGFSLNRRPRRPCRCWRRPERCDWSWAPVS